VIKLKPNAGYTFAGLAKTGSSATGSSPGLPGWIKIFTAAAPSYAVTSTSQLPVANIVVSYTSSGTRNTPTGDDEVMLTITYPATAVTVSSTFSGLAPTKDDPVYGVSDATVVDNSNSEADFSVTGVRYLVLSGGSWVSFTGTFAATTVYRSVITLTRTGATVTAPGGYTFAGLNNAGIKALVTDISTGSIISPTEDVLSSAATLEITVEWPATGS